MNYLLIQVSTFCQVAQLHHLWNFFQGFEGLLCCSNSPCFVCTHNHAKPNVTMALLTFQPILVLFIIHFSLFDINITFVRPVESFERVLNEF